MESLNVIALISGGKDSFFSILHCQRNGHRVIALANLHPPSNPNKTSESNEAQAEIEDLNSFMFQTVGHTVIPLYAQALDLPLYRQEIRGDAVQKGTSYVHLPVTKDENQNADETESLLPLLRKIINDHPSANALSTGAILSTYQRTRIESVALRLGLTPLSFLWKYPTLPPGTQVSLLQDMHAVGIDARLVKVASGGLDDRFLWQNIADPLTISKVERAMSRFGTLGDGGVLGEGGEFETLVLDGPRSLFKNKILIEEKKRRIVYESGGAAWLGFMGAEVVMKEEQSIAEEMACRVPDLLDQRFQSALDSLSSVHSPQRTGELVSNPDLVLHHHTLKGSGLSQLGDENGGTYYWSVSAPLTEDGLSIIEEAEHVTAEIEKRLGSLKLNATDIISTVILLRNMSDFNAINTVYGKLFTQPNPPARVTVACGSAMPIGMNLIIHLHARSHVNERNLQNLQEKRSLHVQSRSYWAPANIGPYSQAISYSSRSLVCIAGQIPLIPASMVLPKLSDPRENFSLQTILALQHLWRIGIEMGVFWWSSSVIYFPSSSSCSLPLHLRISLCAEAWNSVHSSFLPSDDEEEDRDLWEEQNYRSMQTHGIKEAAHELPDWEAVSHQTTEGYEQQGKTAPPVFIAEVEELPRGSEVEWHAHLGVSKGRVVLHTQKGKGWIRYKCLVAGAQVQDMVMVDQGVDLDRILERERCWSRYVDADTPSQGGSMGMIPCQSLWAADGRRLAAVLFLLPPPGT